MKGKTKRKVRKFITFPYFATKEFFRVQKEYFSLRSIKKTRARIKKNPENYIEITNMHNYEDISVGKFGEVIGQDTDQAHLIQKELQSRGFKKSK